MRVWLPGWSARLPTVRRAWRTPGATPNLPPWARSGRRAAAKWSPGPPQAAAGGTTQVPNETGLSGPGIQEITGLAARGGTLPGVGFTASESGEQLILWNVPAS